MHRPGRSLSDSLETAQLRMSLASTNSHPQPALLPGAIDRRAVQPPFGAGPSGIGAAAKAPAIERIKGRAACVEQCSLLHAQQRLYARHLLGRLI